MATYFPLQQQLDPLGQALGQGLGQGINQWYMNSLFDKDTQALFQYMQQQQLAPQTQLPVGQQGPQFSAGQVQFPQMRSQAGQQMALQGQMQNIFQKPLMPTQQIASRKLAKIDYLQRLVDAGTATSNERAMLEKMLAGQPMVQIGLGQPASPSERTKIAETRASIDALNNLKELYDNAKTRTGPVVGRADPILGVFGWTTNEQEDFMAATSAFRNKIIEEITGAQMSEVEAKRILKQVPQETDPPARWEAKWKQSKKNLEMLQKRRMQILQQSGIRVPMGEQELTIGGQTEKGTPITATNPQTGEKIQSTDGGKTWQPIQ